MRNPASIIDIVAFATAARSGSFAAAGIRLGRSRSTVAKAVARLEERFGTRLMTRSTRHLALTEDGRQFLTRCEPILTDLEAAEADVTGQADVPRGILRIALPEAYGEAELLPVISRFLATYPAVQVELRLSDRIGGLVEQGDDVAIRIGVPDTLPPDLISRVVGRAHHGFYAAPAYLRDHGVPTTFDELAAHDAIPYNTGARVRRWRMLGNDGAWIDLPNASRISADSSRGLLAAAIQGLGIAYLPVAVARAAVASGTLVELLADADRPGLPIVALYQSRRNLPGKVRSFLDLLTADAAPGDRASESGQMIGDSSVRKAMTCF